MRKRVKRLLIASGCLSVLLLTTVLFRREIGKAEYLLWLDRAISVHSNEEADRKIAGPYGGGDIRLQNPRTLGALRETVREARPVELYGLSTIGTVCETRAGPVCYVEGKLVADGSGLLWKGLIGTYGFDISLSQWSAVRVYQDMLDQKGEGYGLRLN